MVHFLVDALELSIVHSRKVEVLVLLDSIRLHKLFIAKSFIIYESVTFKGHERTKLHINLVKRHTALRNVPINATHGTMWHHVQGSS